MIKKLRSLALIGLLVSGNFVVQAQFTDALSPMYSYGIAPIESQHTGNDILDVAGVSYEVSVCDDPIGNNAIMGYKVGSLMTFIQIGQGGQVLDPDVCLVKNGAGTVYAVVVYYDPGTNEFKMQNFYWHPVQMQMIDSPPITIASGTYFKSINCDSEGTSYFAIVWDEPGNIINLAFGSALGGQAPTLTNNGAVLLLDPGSEPDVCYYRQASNGYKQIDIVYKNPVNYMLVDFYKLADLTSGTVAPTHAFRSPLADLAYKTPRIACPITASGQPEDFTVVVEDSDNSSTWYIKSFNSNACCAPAIEYTIYNDGSTSYSPFNLTLVPNTKPVVAYDDVDNTIWVAWNIDNSYGLLSAPGAPIGKFPVAVSSDKRAGLSIASKFLLVPEVIPFSASNTNLAIAGGKSANVMFTYNDNDIQEILSKSLPHASAASHLRTGVSNGNVYMWLQQVRREISGNQELELLVHDYTGRLVLREKNDAGSIAERLMKYNADGKSGIYVVQVYSPDGTYTFADKVFFGR